MAQVIQMRRGTAAEWTAANPLLAQGEIGTELDTHKWKCGDGSLRWADLPYVTGGPGPQGPKGDTGATGPAGSNGAQGPKGDKGDPGTAGAPGAAGATGPAGAAGAKGDKGDTGTAGAPGTPGVGVPAGGTTSQVLAKKSATDFDTQWVAQTGGGGGGGVGNTGARAYRNAPFTYPTGVWTTIPLDTASFDAGGHLTLGAASKYTVAAAGYYKVDGHAALTVTPGYFYAISVFKNGLEMARGDYLAQRGALAGDNLDIQVHDLVQCAAGDTLSIGVYAQTASAIQAATPINNYMSVVQVDQAGPPGPAGPAGTSGNLDMYAQATARPITYMPNATWTLLSLAGSALTITRSDGTNPDFVLNADGSLTIVKAGNYSITATTLNVAAPVTGATQLSYLMKKNGATPTPINNDPYLTTSVSTVTNNPNNSATEHLVSEAVCAAGDIIALWGWQSPATGAGWQVFDFKVSRIGAGPVGPAGPAGPAGGVGNTAARACRVAAFTSVGGTYNKIPVDSVTYDPGGHISTANGRYVASVAGYYQVNGEVGFAVPVAADCMVHCDLYVNGALASVGTVMPRGDPAGYARTSIADVYHLNVGDYVELYAYTSGSFALYTGLGGANNYLAVVQVDQAGPQGPPGPSQGVPVGGTTGQALTKKSAADLDTQWTTPAGAPSYSHWWRVGDNSASGYTNVQGSYGFMASPVVAVPSKAGQTYRVRATFSVAGSTNGGVASQVRCALVYGTKVLITQLVSVDTNNYLYQSVTLESEFVYDPAATPASIAIGYQPMTVGAYAWLSNLNGSVPSILLEEVAASL